MVYQKCNTLRETRQKEIGINLTLPSTDVSLFLFIIPHKRIDLWKKIKSNEQQDFFFNFEKYSKKLGQKKIPFDAIYAPLSVVRLFALSSCSKFIN